MLQSITLCCRVPIALCCRILLRVTEYYPALQSITPCYRDPTTPVWAVSADNIKHIRVTEYYSVLEYYPVLQSITPCYRVLSHVTECYSVLQGPHYRPVWAVLAGNLSSLCYRVLPRVTEYYPTSQSITPCYRDPTTPLPVWAVSADNLSVLQSITPCCRVLLPVTEYYSVLQGPHYPSLGSISG